MKRCLFVISLVLLISAATFGQTNLQPQQQNSSTQSATPQSPDGQPAHGQAAQTPPGSDPGVAPANGQSSEGQTPDSQAQSSNYNKAIFQNSIPSDHLLFLKKFDGAATGELARDSRFRKLLKSVIPDCMFHYGRDMPLVDAMDIVLNDSDERVQLRDDRYLIVPGRRGPYLQGRGFLWFDLQDGIALGAFYFHPINGEPTPAVNVFSRQVKEEYLAISELPPAFADDLNHWAEESRIPTVTPRYFITGSNRKILLEHDENYCLAAGAGDPSPASEPVTQGPTGDSGAAAEPTECERMNADAADIDMDAANYVEQTHHATNATAWMITGQDQKVWLQRRVTVCGDFLACRVSMTRERVRVIIGRPPVIHVGIHVGKR